MGRIVGVDACIDPMGEEPVRVALSQIGQIAARCVEMIPDVDACVIMPNHIHFIVHIPAECGPMQASAPTSGIPQRVRVFKARVTREANRPIFQRSFYDHIIRNEAEYIQICQYIAENPQKWALDRFYNEE